MSKGIDIPIDRLVSEFNSDLWTGFNNEFYGRVFRNERFADFGSKVSPEIWISKDEPARELLKNDRVDSQCFFDVQPTDSIVGSDVHSSNVRIVFMLNLEIVYPDLSRQEATEEAHRAAERIIVNTPFESTRLVRGFQAMTDYDWGSDASQAKADMSPHYCFRFDTDLEFVNC